jgi:hypothetical protein
LIWITDPGGAGPTAQVAAIDSDLPEYLTLVLRCKPTATGRHWVHLWGADVRRDADGFSVSTGGEFHHLNESDPCLRAGYVKLFSGDYFFRPARALWRKSRGTPYSGFSTVGV